DHSLVFRLYGFLGLVDLVLLVIALVDCLATDRPAVRGLHKVAWVLVILFLPLVGSILWFVLGRPLRDAAAVADADLPPRPTAGRATAPDDDPEFLASLARSRREDEEMLHLWEADLRRREEELRRRQETEDDKPKDDDKDT